ncbi:2'-5' RNA ligase family protein [Asanoa sp. NPDC049518]|uniref:2'-5' RNA ligase family protein n=1 Tax=unclassified Asanoa TaxID=2685164 RepID=UPI0034204FFB
MGAAPSKPDGGVWPVVPELSLAGGGRFGRGAFTLMWVGVSGDLEPMRGLHKALRRELKHARFQYDERPWKPHLTLARPGNRIPRAELDADRAALDAYAGPVWPVRELFLMRSNLGPDPTYERLTNWLL